MVKRTAIEMKKEILNILNDNLEHSYADLERKVNTNWQTIRNQCKELEIFEAVTLNDNKVKITEEGKKYLRKF